MSHHSQAVSSHSHARTSLNHSQSHRSHSLSQNSHPSFTYSHAPFTQPGPGSCAHSERSHASSYGPPGLPPPYCLARLAPKTSVSSSTPPGAPPGRELAAVPPELTASRQSFQHAMGNPCEFFVDIMWQDSAFQNSSSTKRFSPPNPCRLLPASLPVLRLSDCLWVQDADTAWPSTYSPAICLSLWCLSKGIQAASVTAGGIPPTHTSTGLLWLKTHFSIDVMCTVCETWVVFSLVILFTLPCRHSWECEPNLGCALFCKTFQLAGPGSQSPRPGPTAT